MDIRLPKEVKKTGCYRNLTTNRYEFWGRVNNRIAMVGWYPLDQSRDVDGNLIPLPQRQKAFEKWLNSAWKKWGEWMAREKRTSRPVEIVTSKGDPAKN